MPRPTTLLVAIAIATLNPGAVRAWTLDEPLGSAAASWLGLTPDGGAGVVAAAGDVDGDGLADLLIAAPLGAGAGPGAGRVYVVLGQAGGWVMDAPLASADAWFVGESAGDRAGTSIAGGGDLDSDGLADLLIGAPDNDEAAGAAGQVYVLLGGAAAWGVGVDLGLADASFLGEAAGDRAGAAVALIGDVNASGYGDLLIGAAGNDEAGGDAGQAYVVYGDAVGWTSDTALSGADASFLGEAAGDGAGAAVARLGDVNGDGPRDLLIAAPGNDEAGSDAGQVYLVLGDVAGWGSDTPLSSADGSFLGEAADDGAGVAVAGAGDVDGDGLGDLLIGATGNDEGAADGGQVYLILGRSSGWLMDVPLSVANASFLGERAGAWAGAALATAGDVDGNGIDDFVVGAPDDDDAAAAAGQVYLVRTSLGLLMPDTSLGAVDASWLGEAADDLAGASVAGVGDVDGDGYDDLLVGAPGNDDGPANAGQAYLLLGSGPCIDGDGDGYGHPGSPSCPAGPEDDCQDGDPLVNPGVAEACDGQDNDCDGDVDEDVAVDADGDGYNACQGDCDDADPAVYPGATEVCNGVDDDCDGFLGTGEWDEDLDGWLICDGDCDDLADHIHPGMAESPCNGIDDDCDPATEDMPDDDGDGFTSCDDCDDADPTAHPGVPYDDCDGIDSDCNGLIDDGDEDGDGLLACDDCDDFDANLDGADDDGDGYSVCDGDCDDADASLNLDDLDGDGSSTCTGDCDDTDATLTGVDVDGDGYSVCDGDCDEADAAVYPDAPELCNGLDDDCDGDVDEDTGDDMDGDGFTPCDGDCDDTDPVLNPLDLDGDGYTPCDGDCDDSDPGAFPGQDDPCDGIDNDCDGIPDDIDEDGDGYYTADCGHDDCDDADPDIHPGAHEICYDEIDNDCDTLTDQADPDCTPPDDDDDDDDDDATGDDDDDDDDDDDSTPNSWDDDGGADGCACGRPHRAPGAEPGAGLAAMLLLGGIGSWRRRR